MTKKYFTKMHNAVHNFGWKKKLKVGQHQWKLTLFTANKQSFNTAENKNHPQLHAFCSYHLDKKRPHSQPFSQVHKQLLGDSTSIFMPVDHALGLCTIYTVAQGTDMNQKKNPYKNPNKSPFCGWVSFLCNQFPNQLIVQCTKTYTDKYKGAAVGDGNRELNFELAD